MRSRVEVNFGVYLNLILLCLLLTFGSGCVGKTSVISDDCGEGSSEYSLSTVGTIDTSFDCNASGLFVVNLTPFVRGDYQEFCRLWFELDRDGDVYRSNYVQFFTGHFTDEQLEWGGSLPTGKYWMKAIMQNIQLSSSCPDSVFWEHVLWLGDISITEFSNPEKVMEIEYFCQDSDTGIIDRYDVFLSPNTAEYMDIAFKIANTRYNVTTHDTDLSPQLITYDIDMWIIKQYIFALKQWENEMFLCGIKGFKDTLGYYHPEYTGVTYFFSTPIPACSTGSLVAVKGCIDIVANEYKIDYKDFVTATTIHELGHQRASILHQDYHDTQFCVMHLGLVVIGDRNRYSNPHFCNNCISRLKNISW